MGTFVADFETTLQEPVKVWLAGIKDLYDSDMDISKNSFKYFDNLKALGFDIPYTCIIQATTTEAELIDIVVDRLANSEFELDGIILTQFILFYNKNLHLSTVI